MKNNKIICKRIESGWTTSPLQELEIFLNKNLNIEILGITEFLGSYTVIYKIKQTQKKK